MTTEQFFTPDERQQLFPLYRRLLQLSGDSLREGDCRKVKDRLIGSASSGLISRDVFGLNPVIKDMQTAVIVAEEIGMRRASIISLMLLESVRSGGYTLPEVERDYGHDVATIIGGLLRIGELYAKSQTIETENFRNLLLTFAEDMRVILIMIADRVNLIRQIKDRGTDDDRRRVATEASYLYAPLAHKLGLYQLKSELEDLSLKYTEREVYYHIKDKLNATKAARDRYIDSFIAPVQAKLQAAGLKFHIKGRTKSIHSIYQKMKRQKCPFEGVYDLFAIRVILDAPLDKEKAECWQAYSIVTDMYQPNPKRLRDWLSVPKSNGYESLHITVMGPEGKWVEVQIRTERMDEIAERGLAAHWRYKGIKGESGIDEWLTTVREALENTSETNGLEAMDQFKLELYQDEVFVFTPKGDLFKLSKGATVLDFAFQIHTKIGSHCTGAKVNGKNVRLNCVLHSGDQVEIMTSATQTPKQDWLNIAVTSKARTKIKQALKEIAAKQHDMAREDLKRKFRNRKIDYEEPTMMRLIKRMGFKVITDFYQALADGVLNVNDIIDNYLEQQRRDNDDRDPMPARSADGYSLQTRQTEQPSGKHDDVLLIGKGMRSLEFKLARCCNPIYGDDIFGFVSVSGGIKIHRTDCPNGPDLRQRFGYRIVKARWAGQPSQGTQYAAMMHVVGHDDIGIVTNITSIIQKEEGINLRNISIDSHDGLFTGTLTVLVSDTGRLQALLKKLRTVKGVKQVTRE